MNRPGQDDIQGVVALLNAGKAAEAVAAAQTLIGQNPSIPVVYFFLASGQISLGKLDQAVDAYKQALALKPDFFDAVSNMAAVQHRQGKLAEAIISYRKAVHLNGRHAFSLSNLGTALRQTGSADEAIGFLRRAAELEPKNGVILGNLAMAEQAAGVASAPTLSRLLDEPAADVTTRMWAALMLGRPEQAFAFRPEKLNVIPYSELGALYRRVDLESRVRKLPELAGTRPPSSARPLLIAAADGHYARMFAHKLIGSALEKSPDCDVHLHLMNPGSFVPEHELALFPRDRVRWTSEEVGPCAKTLYSTRRFVRLAQFMDGLDRTVMSIDMDCVINGALSRALPDRFDVVLYERPEKPLVNQIVNAGFMAFAPGGKDFLDFIAAYILHFDDLGTSKWYVDQMAIAAARAWFSEHVPGLAIKPAPSQMMDSTGTDRPDCLIWHAKGNLKGK